MDHGALLEYQVKVEELATAPGVRPRLDRGFLNDARLDFPVARELVQYPDGHLVFPAVVRNHDSIFPVLGLFLGVPAGRARSICAIVHLNLSRPVGGSSGGHLGSRQLKIVAVREGIVLLILGVVLRHAYLLVDVLAKHFR